MPTYNPMNRAPDHLPYLSPHCAQLNDGIRTASVRGVQGSTLYELQANYRRDCAEDERAALQELYRVQQGQREADRARRGAEQAARDQVRMQREQCDELRRILHLRRRRIDTLTDGQKQDLQRAQENYERRCQAG